jgi:excisionase family DNA binding protein
MYPHTVRIREPLPVNGRPPSISLLDPEDELVTIKGAAELCKVDPTFIRKAINNRELRMVVLGPKTHRVLRSSLHRWWKNRSTKGVITQC